MELSTWETTALRIMELDQLWTDFKGAGSILWETKPHLSSLVFQMGNWVPDNPLASLRWWDKPVRRQVKKGPIKLGQSPLHVRKSWECASIFMKDNRADKGLWYINSISWSGAAPCNKQPHSCHPIQSTDSKTWTSFYRSGCGRSFLAGCFCNIKFTKKEDKISLLINVNVRGNQAALELRACDDILVISNHSLV